MRGAVNRYADGLQLVDDSRRIAGMEVQFLPTTRRLHTHPRSPATKPPYGLAFIGRWHPNKGVDVLLDALAVLTDEDWQLIREVSIHGGGPLSGVVQAKGSALLASGRPLVLGGYLTKPAAEEVISRADYIVIPSRVESIPVVFSDAMKLARPVISTPVGDLARLLNESEAGILADQAEPMALARAIRQALHRSPVEFIAATRAHAGQFDLTEIARRLLSELNG